MKLFEDKALQKSMFRKRIFNGLFLIVLSTGGGEANALPNFASGFQLENIQFYPDHEEQGLFYYMPNDLEMSKRDNKPLFGYDVFRYVGRKMTGDAGNFRVRGVLTFEIEKASPQEALRIAEKELNRNYKEIIFRPVPIKEFDSKLIYNTTEAKGSASQLTEIEGGISIADGIDSKEGQWQRRRFTIGLQPDTAQLFWDNFQNSRLQLSLSYYWKGMGVVPAKDTNTAEKWEPAYREIANAIPINISVKEYPELFRKNETWQEMTMGHTNLTVYCYDFINESKTDLYSVTVEVMFRTLRDQDYKEKVKFVENDDAYKKNISFRLAKNLDAGYKYRINRLYQDGRSEKSKWQKFNSQHLDATFYAN